MPTGIIAAVFTFASHAVVRQLADLDQARAVTTITLWIIAFWILCVLARPIDWWRALLLGAMVAIFLLVLTLPIGRDFFAMPVQLDGTVAIGVGFGVAGAARHRGDVPHRAETRAHL